MKKYFYLFYIIIFLFSSIDLSSQSRSANKKASPKNYFHQERKYEKKNKSFNAEEAETKSFTSLRKNYNEKEEVSVNYFRIDRSGKTLWDGKHWDANDFPLKVFVKESRSKYFKKKYKKYIDYAFEIWSLADKRIEFTEISRSSEADMIITFEENLMEKYDENFLGLTDYIMKRDNKIDKSLIEIGLLKYNDELISEGEIKATIIHEIGHALGLGHSDSDFDIMYPLINPQTPPDLNYNELSMGDVEAVKSVINLGQKIRYTIK